MPWLLTDRMHILYPEPRPIPSAEPESLQVLNTVNALGQLGIKVTLVTPRPESSLSVDDVLGEPLCDKVGFKYLEPKRGRSNKAFYRQVIALRKAIAVDAVLVRNLKMADWLLGAGEQRLIFETHEHFTQTYREEHPKLGLKKRFKLVQLAKREERVYRGAKGLISLTQLLADDLISAYGQLPAIAIAPDGVSLSQAQAVKSLSRNRLVVLYLGSLHPWKGVEVVIRAMQEVEGADLHIVGGNPQRIEELTSLVKSLGISDRVRLLGPVDPNERFQAIADADICSLPLINTSIGSRYTSPLKLFEYMAVGRAVIASDLPSLREVLSDRRNALLVPAENVCELSRAINLLCEDGELRARIATQAQEDAEGYSWENRAKLISNLVSAVISQ